MTWGDLALARHAPVEDEASIDLNVYFFRRQNLNKYQRAFPLGVGAHGARHACSPCKARPTVILECARAALPRKTNAEHTVTPHAAFPNYAFAAAGPRAETYVFTCIMEGAPERPSLVFSRIAALSPCITNDEQSSRSVVFRWLRKRPPNHTCAPPILYLRRGRAHIARRNGCEHGI